MRKALITGALGQDGSYLSEHLLKLGYEVWGTVRMNPSCHEHYIKGVRYVYADLTDPLSLMKVIRQSSPDELYNLGGQVFVPNSFVDPCGTFDANTSGLARILLILEQLKLKDTRVYQASTSEMFGNVLAGPGVVSLDENVEMNPVSPYGVSKLAAHKLVDVYRQRGMYVVSGILFNHESPRRGLEMVTRKITRQIAKWVGVSGDRTPLRLGTLDAERDWGFAGDFVEAMHLMLQQAQPDDYVIGTGVAHSIEDFLVKALACVGLTPKDALLEFNCPDLIRSPELHTLVADYTKAKTQLSWHPKHSFDELVRMMMEHDCKLTGAEVNLCTKS